MAEGYVFHRSVFDALKRMSKEQIAWLVMAMSAHAFEGIEPEETDVDPLLLGLYGVVIRSIDSAGARYESAKKASETRWSKSKSKPAPEEAKEEKPAAAPKQKSQEEPKPAANEQQNKQTNQPKPAETATRAPSAPKNTKRLGRCFNVLLTPVEYEKIKQEFPDADPLIHSYSLAKLDWRSHQAEGKPNELYDYPALRFYARHGTLPGEKYACTNPQRFDKHDRLLPCPNVE